MINLAEYTTGKSKDYFKAIKRVSPKIKALKAGKALPGRRRKLS